LLFTPHSVSKTEGHSRQILAYEGYLRSSHAFTAMRKAPKALATGGRYDGMDQAKWVAARQAIEDIIGP
jgi:hypothetical protein